LYAISFLTAGDCVMPINTKQKEYQGFEDT